MRSLASIPVEQAIRAPDPASVERQEAAARNVRNLFKLMHGQYGNLFLSRFQTGQVGEDGSDKGVISAMRVWARDLAAFDGGVIETAAERCKVKYVEFPPNQPQFLAECRACAPREAKLKDHDQVKAIPMGAALGSVYARRARAINAKHDAKAAQTRDEIAPPPPSLDGLKQAIANAVANAGGDEVGELLRLDRVLAPRRTPC